MQEGVDTCCLTMQGDLRRYLCGRRMTGSFKGTMVSEVWAEMEKSWKETETFNCYKRKGVQRQAIETILKGNKEHLLYKNRKEITSQTICHVKDQNSLSCLMSSLFFCLIFCYDIFMWRKT